MVTAPSVPFDPGVERVTSAPGSFANISSSFWDRGLSWRRDHRPEVQLGARPRRICEERCVALPDAFGVDGLVAVELPCLDVNDDSVPFWLPSVARRI